jgi:hypothetical protein
VQLADAVAYDRYELFQVFLRKPVEEVEIGVCLQEFLNDLGKPFLGHLSSRSEVDNNKAEIPLPVKQ